MPKIEPKVELLTATPEPSLIVALGARLCYSGADISALKQKLTGEEQKKFIRTLVDMGHESPLEHASFTFGIEGVSRALLAQITRHRIASFSVQSQRYSSPVRDGDFNYIIPPAITRLGQDAVLKYESQMRYMRDWYVEWNRLLGESGERSNEDARFVLPNACETRMLVTMNARELLHFFRLRCCNRAQWEIREVAWLMLGKCMQTAPSIFESAGPSCVTGSCSEGKMSCGLAGEVRAKQQAIVKESV